MGTLVCKHCNATIDHFEDEKVTVLYSKCDCCNNVNKENKNNEK
ncbi:GapA-binding peptide SR1P [Metabacillus bambusae]|uniref:GapA-binding peptide SR1P n=1 Tax=Metabacillus bambusae TaxID=2795218 RepID=A0ABS3N5Z4_9BACI|nr:GapA-binding peptide SR1P [Metabacillus bambusae]MBO1513460.1 GapA-binding peptide SR1P [Metabacillus bambusae]